MAYLGLVGSTAVAAIGQSATPRLAKCYAARERKAFALLLVQLVGMGAGLGLLGVAVALVAGPQFLAIFYGHEYARAQRHPGVAHACRGDRLCGGVLRVRHHRGPVLQYPDSPFRLCCGRDRRHLLVARAQVRNVRRRVIAAHRGIDAVRWYGDHSGSCRARAGDTAGRTRHFSRKTSMIRVLHSLGSLQHGGIETWLLQVMRHTDCDRFRMDFLVHTEEAGVFDREVRALGSRIIFCPPTGLRRPWSYVAYPRQLLSVLRKFGPYDIVHGHMQEFSGYLLRAAAKAGVPARIAHSHNCDSVGAWRPGPVRRAYNRVLSSWIDRYATLGLACSRAAARSLYGENWENDRRRRVLHYGIDLAPFCESLDLPGERQRCGLPAGVPVVGHVGRFVPQKNHAFCWRSLPPVSVCGRRSTSSSSATVRFDRQFRRRSRIAGYRGTSSSPARAATCRV